MTNTLRKAFEEEMRAAGAAFQQDRLDLSFHHLERAHVLGQRFAAPHVRAHGWMLRVGWAKRDAREVLGQVQRLIGAGPLSLLGWLPIGNTGGASVSAVRPMPIPDDLKELLAAEERKVGSQ